MTPKRGQFQLLVVNKTLLINKMLLLFSSWNRILIFAAFDGFINIDIIAEKEEEM